MDREGTPRQPTEGDGGGVGGGGCDGGRRAGHVRPLDGGVGGWRDRGGPGIAHRRRGPPAGPAPERCPRAEPPPPGKGHPPDYPARAPPWSTPPPNRPR